MSADRMDGPLNDRLTKRERAVLKLLAEGNSVKEIAAVLDLSINTIESYRSTLMNKLGIHKAVLLVHYAIRHGITELLF